MNAAELKGIQKKLDELEKQAAVTDKKSKQLSHDVVRVKEDVSKTKERATVVQRLLAR